MSRLGEREIERAQVVLRRLGALRSALEESFPQHFTDECEDLLPALIAFAMQNREIDAQLYWAYGQDAFSVDDSGFHPNPAVHHSLEDVGAVLDEYFLLVEPRQRLGGAISLLSRNQNELWIRKASKAGTGHWLDDWVFVEIDRLLWDLEDAFAVADIEVDVDVEGDGSLGGDAA